MPGDGEQAVQHAAVLARRHLQLALHLRPTLQLLFRLTAALQLQHLQACARHVHGVGHDNCGATGSAPA